MTHPTTHRGGRPFCAHRYRHRRPTLERLEDRNLAGAIPLSLESAGLVEAPLTLVSLVDAPPKDNTRAGWVAEMLEPALAERERQLAVLASLFEREIGRPPVAPPVIPLFAPTTPAPVGQGLPLVQYVQSPARPGGVSAPASPSGQPGAVTPGAADGGAQAGRPAAPAPASPVGAEVPVVPPAKVPPDGGEEDGAPVTRSADLTVRFRYAAMTAAESAGNVPIRVDLSEPVPAGEDDPIQEYYETVEITLANPVNAALGTPSVHTLTVADNDGGLAQTQLPQAANFQRVHQGSLGVPGLSGSGVKVGVVEPPRDATVGVNPAKVELRTGALQQNQNYRLSNLPMMADAPAIANPDNDHMTLVSAVMASNDPFQPGVAPEAEVYAASFFGEGDLRGAVDWYHRTYSVNLFNHSWSYGTLDNDNGDNSHARFLDWHSRKYDTLHVVAAGNKGAGTRQLTQPADQSNGITVGAVDSLFRARAGYSSYLLKDDTGAAADRRSKPDILAPGGDDTVKISNGRIMMSGTSFATPHVTGVAALLMDENLPNRLVLGSPAGAAFPRHLAAKAIILNSARKRFIGGPENDYPHALDHINSSAEASDADYLVGAGALRTESSTATAPKTSAWTPAAWSTNHAGLLTVTKPLDDEQGVGVLDAARAIIQHQGGNRDAGPVAPIGWSLGELAAADGLRIYDLPNLAAGSFITATLCWDRVLDEKQNDGTAGDGNVEERDKYEDRPVAGNDLGVLPDFNLSIFQGETLVAQSSAEAEGLDGENVEHLHFPVGESGAYYQVVVHIDGGSSTKNYDYALAWWAVPGPDQPPGPW